jgi:hypothetical protein
MDWRANHSTRFRRETIKGGVRDGHRDAAARNDISNSHEWMMSGSRSRSSERKRLRARAASHTRGAGLIAAPRDNRG